MALPPADLPRGSQEFNELLAPLDNSGRGLPQNVRGTKMGRPKEGDLAKIYALMSEGLSCRKAAMELGLCPSQTLQAIRRDPLENAAYEQARAVRAEWFADRGALVVNAMMQKKIKADEARVAIDYYKWTASRMDPKGYGEKNFTEHTGKDGSELSVNVQTNTVIVIHDNGRDPTAD